MAFAIAMSKVVMPEQVRRFDAGSDVAALTKRLFEVSLWQPMVMMLVLSGLFMFGPRIIDTWMGPGYGLSHWVLVCTLGPHVAELVGNVSNVVLQVNGLYWWRAGCFLAAALLYIPVTLLALQYWALSGLLHAQVQESSPRILELLGCCCTRPGSRFSPIGEMSWQALRLCCCWCWESARFSGSCFRMPAGGCMPARWP